MAKKYESLMDFVHRTHERVGKEHAEKGEKPHPDGMIEKSYMKGHGEGRMLKAHEEYANTTKRTYKLPK